MNYLLAFDKFKGSMTAMEACQAVAQAIQEQDANANVVSCPISDGGEGFAEAMVSALGGKIIELEVNDPLNRPVTAHYGMIDRPESEGGKLAVMEMATASGLLLLTHPAPERELEPISRDDLQPLKASSYGTGELMRLSLIHI